MSGLGFAIEPALAAAKDLSISPSVTFLPFSHFRNYFLDGMD